MAATELDFALASFWEFARIWKAGRSCKLVLSCENGHGEVQVVAGLGAAEEPHFPPIQQAQIYRRKKTPSQLRRETRRREERVAEKAAVDSAHERSNKVAEKAEEDSVHERISKEAEEVSDVEDPTKEATANVAAIASDVFDEICPDTDFYRDEIDPAEAARDKDVEKVLVYPMGNDKIDKEFIEAKVKEKFEVIGVTVKDIETHRTLFGELKSCVVDISPVNLNKIWGRRLGIPNCSIISYDP